VKVNTCQVLQGRANHSSWAAPRGLGLQGISNGHLFILQPYRSFAPQAGEQDLFRDDHLVAENRDY